MRRNLIGLGLASLLLANLACGPAARVGSGRPAGGPRQVVVLAQEPLCIYRVLGEVRHNTRQSGRSLTEQARSMGAHALLNQREIPEFDSTGRPVAATFVAEAIMFSDPADPSCYK
jgi:hypothetical protein